MKDEKYYKDYFFKNDDLNDTNYYKEYNFSCRHTDYDFCCESNQSSNPSNETNLLNADCVQVSIFLDDIMRVALSNEVEGYELAKRTSVSCIDGACEYVKFKCNDAKVGTFRLADDTKRLAKDLYDLHDVTVRSCRYSCCKSVTYGNLGCKYAAKEIKDLAYKFDTLAKKMYCLAYKIKESCNNINNPNFISCRDAANQMYYLLEKHDFNRRLGFRLSSMIRINCRCSKC